MDDHASTEFYASTMRDPLFATEGMDIENAESAIDEIESALTALETEYASGSFMRRLFFARYPLPKHAVPVSFLRAMLASERQRRVYVAAPSRAAAVRLLDAWREASDALSNNLKRYRTLHEILVRLEYNPKTFVMQDAFGHLTTYACVTQTLDALERNASALRTEIAQRRALLEHGDPVPQKTLSVSKLPTLRPCELSDEQRRFHEAEIEGGVSPYRYADILESHGPFRVELGNFSTELREHTCIVYILKEKQTRRKCMWIAFVDRFHFIDIWNMMPKDDGVTRGKYATAVGLEKEEIPFWYEGVAFLYNTRDTRYWMDIATAVDARRRPQLDWNLAGVQKSSLFDLILVECARDTRTMIAHLRRRERSGTSARYSLFYDLLTRTYPSVYYMPFNGSVWRIAEEPPFIGDGFKPPDKAKFLSAERIRNEFTPEVLAKVMRAAKLREERGKAAGWLP